MKVRLLGMSSIAILLQFAVSTHATGTCSLVESQKQATFLPDSVDCSKFQVCVHGIAVSRNCPAGLHWNRVTSSCDYPVRAKCKSLVSAEEQNSAVSRPVQPLIDGKINPLCPSEDVFWESIQLPHPEDCTKFLKCSNGRVWIFNCPSGLQWNVTRNRCDYPNNIKYLTYKWEEKIMTASSLLRTISEDTTNKPLTTVSIESRTSSLSREILSEKPSTTVNNFEETKNTKLFNIDAKESTETILLTPKFENSAYYDETTKTTQFLEWTQNFLEEKTTDQPGKTVAIANTDIKIPDSKEKIIIGDLNESRPENRYETEAETHTTAMQETKTHFTKDRIPEQSQTNIDRSITKTPDKLTSESSNTAVSMKQTTKRTSTVSKVLSTTSQYDASTIMENKNNDSILEKIEQIQDQPIKIVDYEEKTKARKAVVDIFPLPLLGITTKSKSYTPLSKASAHGLNFSSVVEAKHSSTNSEDQIATSSTESTITTTTFDPRLPFKAVECVGINNEERFATTDCRKYYQCLHGYAYLLNCFDGYTFSAEHKICILSDLCEVKDDKPNSIYAVN